MHAWDASKRTGHLFGRRGMYCVWQVLAQLARGIAAELAASNAAAALAVGPLCVQQLAATPTAGVPQVSVYSPSAAGCWVGDGYIQQLSCHRIFCQGLPSC